jgi:[ribosomal protein S18]-alanine N-acetyltransferase
MENYLSQKFEIVNMELSHVDDIIVVEKLCFKIPWSREAFIEEITKNKFAIYRSVKAGERVVGYGGMWKVFDEGHITNIAVHPDFRSNGIGSLLLERLINIAVEEGITSLTLEVRKSNLIAQSLYSKYGFEIGGLRKAYYADNREDAIIMWKNDIK